LGIEPTFLFLLGKCSATAPSPFGDLLFMFICFFNFAFEIGLPNFAQVSLEFTILSPPPE
jgi:hypothetical protein